MKQEKKLRNKLTACFMCLVLLGAALLRMSEISALAEESYGAWKDAGEFNGSFEVGYEGREVYGWHKTAMQRDTIAKEDVNAESYCKAYTLKTVEDDGNKVAALEKTGSGYVAVTSQKIEVTSAQEYRISFDYKTLSYELKDTTVTNANANVHHGIRLYVEELDETGNTTVPVNNAELTKYFEDTTNVGEWSTGMAQFKTQASTKYLIIYLWMGAGYNVKTTVHFDNVLLEAANDYKVFNGTFDQTTYLADGGRTAGDMGPAGWTMVTANGSGKVGSASNASKSSNVFKATTVSDTDRGNVVLLELTGSTGYGMLQSPYIPVDGIKACHIAADCKLLMYNNDGSTRNMSRNIYFNLTCYSADKTYLGDVASAALGAGTNLQWEKRIGTITTLEGTKYVKVGLYVNFVRGDYDDRVVDGVTQDDIEAAGKFKLYYDNVALDVDNQTLGFTKVSTKDKGEINGNYTSNYAMREVDAGTTYKDAVQLYVTRQGGGMGGTTFYSEPIAVTPGTEYKTEFDFKVEGVTEKGRNYGADYLLRYRTQDGQYLKSGNPDVIVLNTGNADNTDWKHCTGTFVVPEGVVEVEVGLLIGVTTQNYNPDMKNTFANIAIAPANDTEYWTAYEYNKTTTDLLFKLTERGNVYSEDTEIDVLDLVMMKKYVEDESLIDADVLNNADMNANTLINNADIELLHWKLLGVDTEAKAALVQGYKFY